MLATQGSPEPSPPYRAGEPLGAHPSPPGGSHSSLAGGAPLTEESARLPRPGLWRHKDGTSRRLPFVAGAAARAAPRSTAAPRDYPPAGETPAQLDSRPDRERAPLRPRAHRIPPGLFPLMRRHCSRTSRALTAGSAARADPNPTAGNATHAQERASATKTLELVRAITAGGIRHEGIPRAGGKRPYTRECSPYTPQKPAPVGGPIKSPLAQLSDRPGRQSRRWQPSGYESIRLIRHLSCILTDLFWTKFSEINKK